MDSSRSRTAEEEGERLGHVWSCCCIVGVVVGFDSAILLLWSVRRR